MSYKNCMTSKKEPAKLCKRGYCTAKSKFKIYPSAYANGYAAQVCSGDKPDGNGIVKNEYGSSKKNSNSALSRWYKEEWVNVCEKKKDGSFKPCGRKNAKLEKSSYPYCRPIKKMKGTTVKTVSELTKKEREKMCKAKQSIKPGKKSPTRVFISETLVKNPETSRYVKSGGQVGGRLTKGKNIPNMVLVNEYNKDKSKQEKASYRGKEVTLYSPELIMTATKKMKVYVKNPEGKVVEVKFGHPDYEDYTIHRDKERMKNYCARSKGIKCGGKDCDATSANYWSRMVLWDC